MRGLCAPPGRRKLLFARQLGSPAELLGPAKHDVELLPVLLSPPSGSHCVWLNTLNASARNSNEATSLIRKVLKRPMSQFVRLGLLRTFRCESPNVKPSGATNA